MRVRSEAKLLVGVPLVVLALWGWPASAAGALELKPDGIKMELLNDASEPETRAGAHPDRLVQTFEFVGDEGEDDAKELLIDLPLGMGGDVDAVPLCPRASLSEDRDCPKESRIGTFTGGLLGSSPIFNVEPAPSEFALFAVPQFVMSIKVVPKLGGSDGVTLRLRDLPQMSPTEGKLEIWGVPADHQEETDIPRRPLITNPTRCDQPLITTVSANSWQQPDVWIHEAIEGEDELTDCEGLPFAPEFDFSLDSSTVDTPSGAQVEVTVPQDEAVDGRASSMVEDISIQMPVGITVSPGGVASADACSDAQFGPDNAEEPSCPPSSRVGSVEVRPAGAERRFTGSLFLGEERPDDRFRLLVAASVPGAQVKLVGSLKTDPGTGRLTVDLADLPQFAFQDLRLDFDGGPRAVLATPLECGPAPASARLSPYSGAPAVEWSGSVHVTPAGGGDCTGAAPFAPGFSGGSTSRGPGRATSFTATIRRRDGEQLPRDLAIALPRGLSAALGRVETCTTLQLQATSCPGGSRIGSAVAELGPGEHPARIGGDVFLTDPYRRAPFGVALVFRAAFGPFDLGTFAVRGALRVDAFSGQVTVAMDSLPTLFEGVPIRFQTIGLDLDRPGLMVNPTSCAPNHVVASLRAQGGASTRASSPFELRRCIDLPFRPRFAIALGRRKQLHRSGKPSLRMSMRMPRRAANLRSVAVRLPKILELDSGGMKELCARGRAEEGRCQKAARIGTARARTPLLKRRMRGFLYLVQPRGKGSPDIWVSLVGQGLEVNLRAQTAVRRARAETKFVGLPDFPLRFLGLRLRGGDHGIFKLRRRPCDRLVAPVRMAAHNRARTTLRARVGGRPTCNGDA